MLLDLFGFYILNNLLFVLFFVSFIMRFANILQTFCCHVKPDSFLHSNRNSSYATFHDDEESGNSPSSNGVIFGTYFFKKCDHKKLSFFFGLQVEAKAGFIPAYAVITFF